MGLEHYALARNKWDPRIGPRLVATIQEGLFEVVDTQNVQSKLWGVWASARTGSALVSTLNSWYEAEHRGAWKGRLYQRVERATGRWTHMFVAVAPDIRRRLLAAGVEDARVALIGNAVDVDAPAARETRGRLPDVNIPPGATVLCSVGRLVAAKGHEYLVRAMHQLAARYPNLHCVIVGEGELRPDLERQVAQTALQERVHLVGLRQPRETLAILDAADVVVMPSVSEGTPIALLEAGALAKPIVATRVGGIPDMLTDGVDALIVAPAAPEPLAAAVRRLLDDPVLARSLAAAVHRRVRRDFTRQAQVEATLGTYRVALSRRRGAAAYGGVTSRTSHGSGSRSLPSKRPAA